MRRLYDWGQWFRTRSITLFRGTHYWVSQSVMYQMIRNAASKHGMRVRLTDRGNCIDVEVIGDAKPRPGRVVSVGGD